jgi:hypothetical protein
MWRTYSIQTIKTNKLGEYVSSQSDYFAPTLFMAFLFAQGRHPGVRHQCVAIDSVLITDLNHKDLQ